MADTRTQEPDGTEGAAQGVGQGQAATQAGESLPAAERTYTQSEVDELLAGYVEQGEVNRLVGEARRKSRSKFEGYEEYKSKAEQWSDYDEVVAARDKALADVRSLSAAIERRDLIDKVALDTGVPAALLKGDTEDELNASAAAVKAYAGAQAPATPTAPSDKGGPANPSPVTREQIESIKDPEARVRERAKHINLYR